MVSLQRWVKALRDAIDNPWDTDIDSDHPNCFRCGNRMVFHGHDDSGDFPLGEGYWKCDNCGFQITENDL